MDIMEANSTLRVVIMIDHLLFGFGIVESSKKM
jgi:hypothetical protein